MICPKCAEGTIEPVAFKRTGKEASICNVCDTLWLKNEGIRADNGHEFSMYYDGQEFEYMIEEAPKKDQDGLPVQYVSYK